MAKAYQCDRCLQYGKIEHNHSLVVTTDTGKHEQFGCLQYGKIEHNHSLVVTTDTGKHEQFELCATCIRLVLAFIRGPLHREPVER